VDPAPWNPDVESSQDDTLSWLSKERIEQAMMSEIDTGSNDVDAVEDGKGGDQREQGADGEQDPGDLTEEGTDNSQALPEDNGDESTTGVSIDAEETQEVDETGEDDTALMVNVISAENTESTATLEEEGTSTDSAEGKSAAPGTLVEATSVGTTRSPTPAWFAFKPLAAVASAGLIALVTIRARQATAMASLRQEYSQLATDDELQFLPL
jgi:hypothetical protein